MATLFHELLYRPFLNLLVFFYQTLAFHDLGISIIALTVAIRFALFPIFYKGAKNQAILQRIQPQIRKIQHDHKHDRERQSRALLELYKTHRVNPFSSILLLFVQLPVLIALYRAFTQGISVLSPADLYSFIPFPANFQSTFLGLINLSKSSMIIVGLAAVAQYAQGKLALPKGDGQDPAARMGKQMVFLGPVLTLLFFARLPAAISLYWFVSSAFSIVQQIYINKSLNIQNNGHGDGTLPKPGESTL